MWKFYWNKTRALPKAYQKKKNLEKQSKPKIIVGTCKFIPPPSDKGIRRMQNTAVLTNITL